MMMMLTSTTVSRKCFFWKWFYLELLSSQSVFKPDLTTAAVHTINSAILCCNVGSTMSTQSTLIFNSSLQFTNKDFKAFLFGMNN